MHYIAEVVIPPTDDIAASVKVAMSDPYAEDDDDGRPDWCDFYVIGGRFSGHKLECSLDKTALESFYSALKEKDVKCHGLVCGKEEIISSQEAIVDELWREFFPGRGEKCILFQHGSADQYGGDGIQSCDVCRVDEVSDLLTCERLIVCGPNYDESKLAPNFMIACQIWNGINHEKTTFDGKVKSGLAMHVENYKNYNPEYIAKITPKADWFVVTVDYHN